jgi:hypothetical protein
VLAAHGTPHTDRTVARGMSTGSVSTTTSMAQISAAAQTFEGAFSTTKCIHVVTRRELPDET